MQFFVHIECTKELNIIVVIVIKLLLHYMMMLNFPTFIEHNNDFVMNGIILRCSPPISSYQHFDKKNIVDFPRENMGIR
jgi:hypothetical protein